MLHLVFCLDLVHQWVQSRDDQIKVGSCTLLNDSFSSIPVAGDGAQTPRYSAEHGPVPGSGGEPAQLLCCRLANKVHKPHGPAQRGCAKLQGEPLCLELTRLQESIVSTSLLGNSCLQFAVLFALSEVICSRRLELLLASPQRPTMLDQCDRTSAALSVARRTRTPSAGFTVAAVGRRRPASLSSNQHLLAPNIEAEVPLGR